MAVTTQPIIRLHQENKDCRVFIETDQQDRFVLTVNAAIQACQAYGRVAEFNTQFKNLQASLSSWTEKHEAEIAEAYITVRDAAILFLVVQKSQAFNQELEDSLNDLDISIAQDEAFGSEAEPDRG